MKYMPFRETRLAARRRHRQTCLWLPVLLPGVAVLLFVSASNIGCQDCGAQSFTSLLAQAVNENSGDSTENGICGPFELAPLIPDCPLDLVCFTTACEAHNLCYGKCGVSRTACDNDFYQDTILICNDAFTIRDQGLNLCRSLAFTYWLVVATAGRESFDASQDIACGTLNFAPGACCTPDGGCDDCGVQDDCDAAGGAFVPYAPCEELDCIVPDNDDCQNSEMICTDQTDPADLGWCQDEPDVECSVSEQDCADGSPCVPNPLTEYRCTVETDNRLATTDELDAGGACIEAGINSFQADVWYSYVAPCSGRLTVRMCGLDTYDAMLAVYGSSSADHDCVCPADNSDLLECDDDFCGAASVSAVIIDGVVEGACYSIRVGGWSWDGTSNGAQQGLSELDIRMRCEDHGPPPDGDTSD